MNRRNRTHQLIELGGLVKKSGFVEESKDDRALLLGVLLAVTRSLKARENETLFSSWRDQGKVALSQTKGDRS